MKTVTSYSPLTIANSFIDLANEEGRGLTQLQMQKFSYLFYGWGWAFFDEAVIDHHVEAWKYGPVFPPLYYETRFIGPDELKTLIPVDMNEWRYEASSVPKVIPSSRELHRKLLQFVWRRYGHMSGPELVRITHKKGSPWYETWNSTPEGGRRNLVIPDSLIKQEYKKLNSELFGGN